jgi:transcriptional regulator with XRE-family HTH domain
MAAAQRVPGPTIAGNRLMARLVQYRESAGLTQVEVAKSLDWSESKIYRIENGQSRVQTSDLHALLLKYGISDEAVREELTALARASREPSLPRRYAGQLSPEFIEYLEYESFTDHLYNYETKLIPGALQNGGYADAIATAYLAAETQQTDTTAKGIQRKIDAIVDARNDRAHYIRRNDGPPADFIIDEAALHRAVGGESLPWEQRYETMERLFEHLKLLNTKGLKDPTSAVDENGEPVNPAISIQIVPFELGAYAPIGGPFVILEFDNEDDNPLVYLEHYTGDTILRSLKSATWYKRLFDELSQHIPGPEETASILDYIQDVFPRRVEKFPIRSQPRNHAA